MFPFGLYFANATTLYVADEGDGTTTNAATSKTAGLQKWILQNGTWTLAYTLQSGLNLGQQYSVANYPATLNPATDGLRNITGQVNANGTVTLWAITSTISTNGDAGADPNFNFVSITDVLANTRPTPVAAGRRRSPPILRTANAGGALRGVTLAPASAAVPATSVPLILNAVNPGAVAIAPGSLATANGQNLAGTNPSSVTITDASGIVTTAQVVSSSANQILFVVPSTVTIGTAQVTVSNGATTQTANNVEISTVSPAIITANGSGLARGNVIQVSSSGAQTVQQVYTANADGAFIPSPVTVGTGAASTYLIMLGTGFAQAGTALTTATINGVAATVTYAGSVSPGIDQINILIPAKLSGAGYVNVQVTAEGVPANPVQITLK